MIWRAAPRTDEPEVPASWRRSIDIAKAWEQTLADPATPRTRKIAMRTSLLMSPDRGGIFDVLVGLTRKRLGGAIAGGAQDMSWLHDRDFARAIDLMIARAHLTGAINLAAPEPLPQRDFMTARRTALGIRVGLPATKWMLARAGAPLGVDRQPRSTAASRNGKRPRSWSVAGRSASRRTKSGVTSQRRRTSRSTAGPGCRRS